ncbi:MAG: hypothetical protein K6B28_00250 [Lachnospiraceae bacterium]|nr:hypothetical protein [Lachnospiraceae bacterium]
MSEEKKVLNDNEMNISGGMIFNAAGYEGDPNRPWEVVNNDNCAVLGCFATKEEAIKEAKKYGDYSYNAQETDWATVCRLRTNPNTY